MRELGLRHDHRIGAVSCKPFAYLRRGNRTCDALGKLVYHPARGTGRRPNPIPNCEIETRDPRFREGWHLRKMLERRMLLTPKATSLPSRICGSASEIVASQ